MRSSCCCGFGAGPRLVVVTVSPISSSTETPKRRATVGSADVADETQCNQCKLKDGQLLPSIPRRGITRNNFINWSYQLQIANMHAGPEVFTFCDKGTGAPLGNFGFSVVGRAIKGLRGTPQPGPEQLNVTEWFYEGVWFDGFWRSKGTVVDAKGRFARHIDDSGLPKTGFPANWMFPDVIA